MGKIASWETILARTDIVGGDIASYEGNATFRGPISKIQMIEDMIKVEMEWTAKLVMGKWVKNETRTVLAIVYYSMPAVIDEGRIYFPIPGIGLAVIIPKGGSKLNPKKVKGLVLKTN